MPIPAMLRDRLVEYLIDGPESGRIFIGARDSYERGRAAAVAAEVEPPTLHECRHGYAALMIAAGVNVKALSTFMGHANIRITLDQYGHLLPGAEDEAAGLLDAFLARQLGGPQVERAEAKAPPRSAAAPSRKSTEPIQSRASSTERTCRQLAQERPGLRRAFLG